MRALALVTLLTLGGSARAQPMPDEPAAPLVTVLLLPEADADFGAGATTEIVGRVHEKNPYQLVLDTNPDPESTWTGYLSFSGRDVASVGGVPFAEVPNTEAAGRSWVLVRQQVALEEGKVSPSGKARGGERVLSGRIVTHMNGLEVQNGDGSEHFSWIEVRGVDGLEADAWLAARGECTWSEALQHPRTLVLDPFLHTQCRRLRFLWSDDSFTTLLFMLAVAVCALALGALGTRACARHGDERRPKSFERAVVVVASACALAVIALAAGSLLDGGRRWLEWATLLAAVAGYVAGHVAAVRGPLRLVIPQLLVTAVAVGIVVIAAHRAGLPALESWLAR